MKTIKPFRLSILTRPFRRQQQDFLGVSVFAMASLAPEPLLMSDQDLWKLAAEEIGPGNVLDMGMPKIEPEWLVSGYAHTAHQDDKTQCAVKAVFHGQAKSLLVSGERYWLNGRATPPQSFERLKLDWAHAYGGPGEPENPEGIGSFDEVIHGVRTRRLPNIELPGARQDAPSRRIAPAGFGGLPPDRPQRLALMGRAYDQQWLQHQYPGFADDMDWRYFNAAPADQRLPGLRELPSRAAYELWNLHPQQPVMRGQLPDWRARCFVSFQQDGGALAEVALHLSTAWFFPHAERVILIWHGTQPIAEDDAADVRHVMPALELAGQERPLQHYQQVLQQRLDPANAVLILRDSDLVPKEIMGPWAGDQVPDVASLPLARNMRAGQEREHERMRARLQSEGLDPDQYLPPLPDPEARPPSSIDDLPEYAKRADQAFERMRAEAARGAQAGARGMPAAVQTGIDIPTLSQLGPRTLPDEVKARIERAMAEVASQTGAPAPRRFDPDRMIRDLARIEEDMLRERRTPQASDEAAESARQREQAAERVRMGHLYGAHLLEAAPPASSIRSRRLRRRLEAAAAGERRFARMNFTGANLAGMDLRGADFSEANLEDVDLSDAQLDGCNFTRAVLARARLARASLTGARMDQANLGGAQCEGADFTGASFRQTLCHKTAFRTCVLAQALFEQTDLLESEWLRCDARGSRWEQVSMIKTALENVAFEGAVLKQASWVECGFKGVSFARATLTACSFVAVDAQEGCDFTEARLVTCSFVHGCTLVQATFGAASLKQCGLRGAVLVGADLTGARLEGCDFSECDLQRACMEGLSAGESLFIRADLREASLQGADLIDASLSKADLRFTNLQGANLFRADVSQAFIDGSTALAGAYTQGAKTLPARRVEPAR